MPKVVHVSALKPGDTVTPVHPYERNERVSPFDAAIVESVSDTAVKLFRPYGHCDNFIYGSTPSVITYVGIENYEVSRTHPDMFYTLWNRLEGNR